MTSLTVLILGGYGTFGGRLARLLAGDSRLTLIISVSARCVSRWRWCGTDHGCASCRAVGGCPALSRPPFLPLPPRRPSIRQKAAFTSAWRSATSGPSLIERFAALKDPRQCWMALFPLPEVLPLGRHDPQPRRDHRRRSWTYRGAPPSRQPWRFCPPHVVSPASRASQACAPSPLSKPRWSATAAPAWNGVATCRPCHSTPSCSPPQWAAIGISRTASTKFSTSSSTKTLAASDQEPGHRTWQPG